MASLDQILLTPRQRELLKKLVHAYETTDPPRMFILTQTSGGDILIHPGIREDVFSGDVEALSDAHLIRMRRVNHGTINFDITPLAIEYLKYLETDARRGEGGMNDSSRNPQETSSTEYFVAHEFTREQIDDLRSAIDMALEESGLKPYYADQELREGHIFKNKILRKIATTRFGIYEISNPNKPNVFLELGAAIATAKPYVIICKKGTPVPADLLGLDRIEYESLKDLTVQLKEKLTPYVE